MLTFDVDYSRAYGNNNINVGEVSCTFTGKGNYTGTINATFNILPASLMDGDIKATDIILRFNGTGMEVENYNITFNSTPLVKDVDFEFLYLNEEIRKSINIQGKGNYANRIKVPCKTERQNLGKCSVSEIPDQIYTGTALTPIPEVQLNGNSLVNGTHFTVSYENNILPGAAKAVLHGTGLLAGDVNRFFNIYCPINKTEISPVPVQRYTGEEVTPEVTLTFGDITLKEGTDYTLAYDKNISPGSAMIIISGKGYYTGTVTKYFGIEKTPISKATYTGIKELHYNGKNQVQTDLKLTYDGKTLQENTDYVLAYSEDMKNPGPKKLSISGIGLFGGVLNIGFNMVREDIAYAQISPMPIPDCTYNGEACTPVLTLTLGDLELEEGTDYELSRAADSIPVDCCSFLAERTNCHHIVTSQSPQYGTMNW